MLIHLLLGILFCIVFLRKGEKSTFKNHIVPWWLAMIAKIISLRINTHGKCAPNPVFIIANHTSWLDIVILGSSQPVSFLAKREIMHWPVLGYLARQAGSMFIKRGQGILSAIAEINNALSHNMNTVIFPEGKISNGDEVKRFFPHLFSTAIENKTTIQPIAIAYPDINKQKKVNPGISLQSESTLFASALAIMGQAYTIAIVSHIHPVYPNSSNRKQLALQTHQLISQAREESYTEYAKR